MKQLLAAVACILLTLLMHAQDDGYWSKSDLSITTLSLVAYISPNAPQGLEVPKNLNGNQNVAANTNNRRRDSMLLVKKTNKEIPEFFRCIVTVKNNNIHAANNAKLIVVLPPHVNAQVNSPGVIMHKYDPTSPFTASVEFSLGNLGANQSKSFEIFLRKSVTTDVHKVTAFTFSNTIDTDAGNNHKETTF